MNNLGSGPGAPGQTRDITAGGYPGSGGSQSKGNVSAQPMPGAQGPWPTASAPAPQNPVVPPLGTGLGQQQVPQQVPRQVI